MKRSLSHIVEYLSILHVFIRLKIKYSGRFFFSHVENTKFKSNQFCYNRLDTVEFWLFILNESVNFVVEYLANWLKRNCDSNGSAWNWFFLWVSNAKQLRKRKIPRIELERYFENRTKCMYYMYHLYFDDAHWRSRIRRLIQGKCVRHSAKMKISAIKICFHAGGIALPNKNLK